MSNFVESHKEDIALLNTKVADAIDSLKIDTSGPLSIAKCIKVTGEINKAIKNVKSLYKAISSVPAEDKAGILLSVTIATINSDEVKAKLSADQIKQVEDFCNDTETVETVVNLVDWIADETLEALDANKDGVVTKEEFEDSVVDILMCSNNCGQGSEGCGCYQPTGCCSCCPSFSVSFSSILAKIFCCGKKSMKYKKTSEVIDLEV